MLVLSHNPVDSVYDSSNRGRWSISHSVCKLDILMLARLPLVMASFRLHVLHLRSRVLQANINLLAEAVLGSSCGYSVLGGQLVERLEVLIVWLLLLLQVKSLPVCGH